MKKTFRSILAGALALLTVSCYDDSAIREEIVKLDERVTAIENTLNADVNGINDLAARLAAAETALAATNASLATAQASIADIVKELDAFDGQVDGLVKNFEDAIKALQASDSKLATDFAAADAALLEKIAAAAAKAAVVKVEEVKGNVVLTLADGSTVSLSKPLANVENSGLVTVVDNMWAVVKADGTTESLGIPVGHPDAAIAFQVSASGDLQYSVNDGEWVNTGVNTSEVAGSAYVINGVQVAEDNSFVTITIGETAYSLPMYVPSVVKFELDRESMYVGYGLSKKVNVTSEGVESFYVASKPDGWKVTVEGNVVVVNAPAQKLVDLGACEVEGEVVLHADADGCEYASFKVTSGPAFSLSVDSATGDIEIFNALSVEYPDYTGMFGPTYDFGDALIGICSLTDFEYFETVDMLIEGAENWVIPAGYLANVKMNLELGNFYEPGVYEEDIYTINIADLGATFYPQAVIEEGFSYVVWAVPQTDEMKKDMFTYAVYKPLKVQPEATAVSFKDVTVNLTASGATGYYASLFESAMFGPESGMTLKDFMLQGYGFGGIWQQFLQSGEPSMMGTPVEPGVEFSLSTLNYGEDLMPETSYTLVIFPYDETKALSDYVYESDVEPFVYEFKTSGIVAGGPEATITANDEQTLYKQIAVDVVAPEGATVYYRFVNKGAYDSYTEAEIVSEALQYCYYPVVGSETILEEYLTPTVKQTKVEKELYAVTITADGKYSVVNGVFSTRELPVDSAITMTVESMTKDADNNVTVVFNVTGASKIAVYPYYSSSLPAAFRVNIVSYGVTANYSSYAWADVVDGKATVTYQSSNDYVFFSAYNVAAGEVEGFMEPASAQVSKFVNQ